MTTEKAIQLLHRLQDEQFDGIHGDERREALEMAVRALEGDGDTISRQAAMVVFENSGLDDDSKDTAVRVLEQLPPVQPEVLACGSGELVQESGDLVKELVQDCVSRSQALNAINVGGDLEGAWRNVAKLPSLSQNVHVPIKDADCISRQQAIEALDKRFDNIPMEQTTEILMLRKDLRGLPSVQYSDAYKAGFNKGYEKAKKEMERQVFVTSDGKVHTITTTWLGDFSPYTCKHCGFHVDSKTRFCPDCGRKASNYE